MNQLTHQPFLHPEVKHHNSFFKLLNRYPFLLKEKTNTAVFRKTKL